MAGATIVQQPTNNDLKQLFQDLNKAKELSNEDAVRLGVALYVKTFSIFFFKK